MQAGAGLESGVRCADAADLPFPSLGATLLSVYRVRPEVPPTRGPVRLRRPRRAGCEGAGLVPLEEGWEREALGRVLGTRLGVRRSHIP